MSIFIIKENGDRVYRIGNDLIIVPVKVTTQIIKWNKNNGDDVAIDKKVFGSLVLSLSKQEDLDAQIIRQDVMDYIKGKIKLNLIGNNYIHNIFHLNSACFIVRCGDENDRVDAIQSYKNDILKYFDK